MILSVEEIVVGKMDGVEGICWIINKGTPTEQTIAIPMWTALDASLETARRARNLIFESQGMVVKEKDDEVRIMSS
jgi:hypothetical protein